MPITAPVPATPAGQPASGSTATLEIAMAYDSSGVVVASPVFAQIPVAGQVDLVFSPESATYDAYVASGLSAWKYAVATGQSGTVSFKSAAPGTDTVLGPLIKAGLTSGNGRIALFRLKNADQTYFSGAFIMNFMGTSNPVRGVAESTFSGPTTGPVLFTNS